MKYEYSFFLNRKLKRYEHLYKFDFGQSKDIELHISNTSCCVRMIRTTKVKPEKFLDPTNYLLSDALKKCLILQLVLYNETNTIKKLIVEETSGEETITYEYNQNVIYSMIEGKLVRKIPKSWNTDSLTRKILDYKKSKSNSLDASLYAYLYSKSKMYETERFIYLWMSMNGLYGFIHNQCLLHNKVSKITGERGEMSELLQLYQLGDKTFTKKEYDVISLDIISLVKKVDLDVITEENMATLLKELDNQIQDLIKAKFGDGYNISSYGCLLLCLPYYFRCKIIHANQHINLFMHADDPNLKCIRILNNLMENFLDENLYKWFDNQYALEMITNNTVQ